MESIQTKAGYANNQSEQFDASVVPGEHATVSEGDTVYFVEQDNEIEAYVAKETLGRGQLSKLEGLVNWGVAREDPNLGATANQYDLDQLDEIASAYGADVAFDREQTQRRDETTNVSLDKKEQTPEDGFIGRALEEGEFRQF